MMFQTVSLDKFVKITHPDDWANEAWSVGRVLVLCDSQIRDGAAQLTLTDRHEPETVYESILVLLNGVDLLGEPQAVAMLIPKSPEAFTTLSTLMDLIAGVEP